MPVAERLISLALVDDDPSFLFEMTNKLQVSGFAVRGYREAATLLRDLARGVTFECIAADVLMPGMTGLDLQQRLAEVASAVPLILFTGYADIEIAVSAMKAGAADFVGKPIDETRLAVSIRASVASARQRAKQQGDIAAVAARVQELGERHRQVLDLMVKGLTSKQIAAALEINHRTVENYRAFVMDRVGVANIAQLVRVMLQLEALMPTSPATSADKADGA